ncbi:hypothetical protein OEA41_007250 [Lepraria neglecta]|uniref:Uncharacterized protein n=1 Tax=Lepraria neglecta TaxID=209136 RepID=A0AAD9ZDB0_9LECA|nr:hypothetical protein OEA41_007250 [Lepraria neglecta]
MYLDYCNITLNSGAHEAAEQKEEISITFLDYSGDFEALDSDGTDILVWAEGINPGRRSYMRNSIIARCKRAAGWNWHSGIKAICSARMTVYLIEEAYGPNSTISTFSPSADGEEGATDYLFRDWAILGAPRRSE